VTSVSAQTPAKSEESTESERDQIVAASQRALADNLPEVAARKLARLDQSGLDKPTRMMLVEALVRSGQNTEALEALGTESAPFWRGAALAGTGRFDEAVAELTTIASQADSPHWAEAILTIESLLHSLGRVEEATAVLAPLADHLTSPRRHEARLRLAELFVLQKNGEGALGVLGDKAGDNEPWPERYAAAHAISNARALTLVQRHAEAIDTLRPLLKPESRASQTEQLLIRTSISDSLARLGRSEEAAPILIEFIDRNPTTPYLDRVFDRLWRYGLLEEPRVREALETWSKDSAPEYSERAGLGLYLIGVRARDRGDTEAALETYSAAIERFPGSRALLRRVHLDMAEIHARAGSTELARQSLELAAPQAVLMPDLQARLDYLIGMIDYSGGEFDSAAKAFSKSANQSAEPIDRLSIGVNAAIAAIRTGEETAFQEATANFAPLGISETVRIEIAAERAVHAAAKLDRQASTLLAEFLEAHPEHHRAAEMELVLAETQLLAFPPRPQAALEHLQSAIARGLDSPALQARADYTAIYIEEAKLNDEAVVNKATAFLKRWTGESDAVSELRVRVRMKLAEVYDRQQDYPNAQTQFEILANELGNDPLAETALFFAGRASMSLLNPEGLDRAVAIFAQVVDLEGELAPVARLYQAKAKRRLGRHDEAVAGLSVLIETVADADLRREAIAEKSEALMILGERDPALLEVAEGTAWQLIHEFEDRGAHLQGRYLIAKIKERVGDIEGAVEACYDALDLSDATLRDMDDPSDLQWLYRVGFTNLEFLERLGRHEAAVTVAERMAVTRGSRSEEARKRAEKLRLQHFIWEVKD